MLPNSSNIGVDRALDFEAPQPISESGPEHELWVLTKMLTRSRLKTKLKLLINQKLVYKVVRVRKPMIYDLSGPVEPEKTKTRCGARTNLPGLMCFCLAVEVEVGHR